MGTSSKIASVIFRLGELVCAAIVLGIIGRFLYVVNLGNGSVNGKLVYAEVIAALSIAFAILLMPPLTYSFYFFPLDLIMFICWIVAFGLLANLTISGTCTARWYWSYWGYYWGRFWFTPRNRITSAVVGSVGCGNWRTVIAFSFISAFAWLVNTLIGLYVVMKRKTEQSENGHTITSSNDAPKRHWWNKKEEQSNFNTIQMQSTV